MSLERRTPARQGGGTSTPLEGNSKHIARGGLERRRTAAKRSVPLGCGCRDPWPCRCTEPPFSDRAIDSWRDAAEHVLAGALMPWVPLEVRHALYRRGGNERALAERLHRGCDGRVS